MTGTIETWYLYDMDDFDPRSHLLTRADEFCSQTGMTKASLGWRVMRDGKFFPRIESGKGFTERTYRKFMDFFQRAAEP